MGKAPVVISQAPQDIINAIREGQFDEAQRVFGKLLHYTVDVTTIWHLTRELTSDQHSAGEKQIAAALADLLPADPVALRLPQPKSLYQSTIDVARDTVALFLDRARAAQQSGSITDDMDLCREMVERCAGFSLAVAQYVWRVSERA